MSFTGNRYFLRPAVACTVLTSCMFTSSAAAQQNRQSPFEHRGDMWTVAAPASWESDPAIRPPTVLRLRGHGRRGFPRYDGTLMRLKIGLDIERYGAEAGRIYVVADAWKRRVQLGYEDELLGDIKQEQVQLAGGVEGLQLLAEKKHEGGLRRSYDYMVVCAASNGQVVLVNGSVEYGRASRRFVNKTGLLQMVRATARSVTVDENQVDLAQLAKAYKSYAWPVDDAMDRALEGSHLLRGRNLQRAAPLLLESIEVYPGIASAHQKLAWLHSAARDPKMLKPQVALWHAQIAVALTDHLDLACLDSLALAYIKTGQKSKASQLFREALEKDPGNGTLRERLALYE